MKFIALAVTLSALATGAFAADTASTKAAPANQKKIETACMKDNAKDHAAYLKCVEDKGGKVTKTAR